MLLATREQRPAGDAERERLGRAALGRGTHGVAVEVEPEPRVLRREGDSQRAPGSRRATAPAATAPPAPSSGSSPPRPSRGSGNRRSPCRSPPRGRKAAAPAAASAGEAPGLQVLDLAAGRPRATRPSGTARNDVRRLPGASGTREAGAALPRAGRDWPPTPRRARSAPSGGERPKVRAHGRGPAARREDRAHDRGTQRTGQARVDAPTVARAGSTRVELDEVGRARLDVGAAPPAEGEEGGLQLLAGHAQSPWCTTASLASSARRPRRSISMATAVSAKRSSSVRNPPSSWNSRRRTAKPRRETPAHQRAGGRSLRLASRAVPQPGEPSAREVGGAEGGGRGARAVEMAEERLRRLRGGHRVRLREEKKLAARGIGTGLVQLDLASTRSDDQRVVGAQGRSRPLGATWPALVVHRHDLVEGSGQGLSGPGADAVGGEPRSSPSGSTTERRGAAKAAAF